MTESRVFQFVTIRKSLIVRTSVVYSVELRNPIPKEFTMRAKNDSPEGPIRLTVELATFGLWASFFGFLRRAYPKAFVLTNILEAEESERALCGALEIEPEELLRTYPSAKTRWDYGWGLGGPIRDSPAHLLEVHDLAPLIPGLVGRCSGQISFVLLLTAQERTLREIQGAIEGVQQEADWEPRVLDKVALLGYSHEGTAYSIKARQRAVLDSLDALESRKRQGSS